MSSFKLRLSLLKIWFLKNIVLFIEIIALVLFILTFTGVLSPNFPIFGKIVEEVRQVWYDSESPDVWVKALTTISSCLMSVGLFMTKAKNIALSDIKNENLKKALVNANFYFNEKGKLVKKIEKATNTDLDGDGKIDETDVGEAKVNTGFFTGIKNAVQELVAIATVKLDDENEDKNKEAYDKVIEDNNMTDAADAAKDLEVVHEVKSSMKKIEKTDEIVDSRIGDIKDCNELTDEQKEATIGLLEKIRAFFHNLFRVKTAEEKEAIAKAKAEKKAEKLAKKEAKAAAKLEKKQAKANTIVKEEAKPEAAKVEKKEAKVKEVKVEKKVVEVKQPEVQKQTEAPKKKQSDIDKFIASLSK